MKYKFSIFLFLLTALQAGAQDILQQASLKLERENHSRLQEKLYLHTDKSFYVTGDIVWFKIYNTDALLNKPIDSDKTVYVELLDGNNKPVLQSKIPLAERSGDGSLQLPLTLSSGNYVLRAYTSWMKNFSPDFFFNKKITVINPLKNQQSDTLVSSSNIDIQFFPEGGDLVDGLESRLAFKLVDGQGKGLDAAGWLIDDNNDTIQKISTMVFGMGNFTIRPVAAKEYRTVFELKDGNTISSKIPKPFDKGYVLQLEDQTEGNLKITVSSNFAPDGTRINLLGHTRQVKNISERTNMAAGKAVFIVDKRNLGKGITTFTVFAEEKSVCERLYFQPPQMQEVKANLSADNYTRRKIAVSINKESRDMLDTSLLSFAVYKIDSLQHRDEMDIVNYLWLTSDLKGFVEHPSFYFSQQPLASKAADNLMLTQGWRRFSWDGLSANQSMPLVYPLETGHQLITASVTSGNQEKPAKGIAVFLSVPSTKHKLYVSVSDENGLARFQVKDFFGSGDVILQTLPADSMYRLAIISPFSETSASYVAGNISPASIDISTLKQYSISMQAANLFHGEKLNQFSSNVSADSFRFYGKAMYIYDLDDYKRFTTMEEVLREYVREINVGVRGSGLALKVFNENIREMVELNNLVTIDGVPLFNTRKIFAYDPLLFKKIEIIPKDYVFGKDKFNAVAAFFTYSENFEGMEAEQGALVVNYEGLQKQREFYSPRYDNERQITSRIPDLRTTLHWQSKIGGNIEFFTSDTRGKFLVSLQGFNKNGEPVSWSEFIDVK